MENVTVEERLEELLDNDEALEKMWNADSPETLMQVFSENNMVLEGITKEEAFEAFQRVKNDELTEDELELVSGGAKLYFMLKVGKYFTIALSGASAGTVLAVVGGVAVIGLATYAGYKIIKKKLG